MTEIEQMTDLAIGVVGAGGRMGRALIAAVLATGSVRLAAASEREGHPSLGQDAASLVGEAPINIPVTADAGRVFEASSVVLDFTAPAATALHARLAAETGTCLVVGTTGLDAGQQKAIKAASEKVAIVQAPNFSVGVNLAMALVERAAASLDESFDIEIVEMHHRHKVDAPSGTALGLGRAAARGRGVDLDAMADRGRDGLAGPRRRGAIGFAALRGGDVVGDHRVIFAADGERLEIGHIAGGRELFSRGAVRAALWASGREPGLYSMQDVLGFSRSEA